MKKKVVILPQLYINQMKSGHAFGFKMFYSLIDVLNKTTWSSDLCRGAPGRLTRRAVTDDLTNSLLSTLFTNISLLRDMADDRVGHGGTRGLFKMYCTSGKIQIIIPSLEADMTGSSPPPS